MLDMLEYGFMQRAFIAGTLIAIVCSVIGLFLVLRRMSLMGDGLAHIAFAGIAGGMFFNIYPLLSALVFTVLSALGIQRLKDMKVHGDAAIAIFFSFGLAVGITLISMSKGFGMDLFSYLFGSILAVNETDLAFISVLCAVTVALVWLFYKELFYITFDEESARAGGLPVEKLNTMLIVLTAVTVVVSMRVVGVLLVSSYIVLPASAALLISRSFQNTLFLAAAIALASTVVGLTAAFYFDAAAGGAIVLVLVGAFVSAMILHKLRVNAAREANLH
ncbi:metal ABC transporter permease [Candidatus Micrarchaeota archaeon]|nr:metal ABC transporter permease [Candidatus Micrarchaeota archaeon]